MWERVAGTLPVRGKSRRLKVQKGAFDDLVGHESGAVAEDHLLYQVPPDSWAQQAEAGRALPRAAPGRSGLQPFYGTQESVGHPQMPEMVYRRAKQGTAGASYRAWCWNCSDAPIYRPSRSRGDPLRDHVETARVRQPP